MARVVCVAAQAYVFPMYTQFPVAPPNVFLTAYCGHVVCSLESCNLEEQLRYFRQPFTTAW
jgi:hypothetical protein